MPPIQPNSVELLAPAGSEEALRAAVANGADAVYLGLGELNARRGATNFNLETLAEACRFAHLRGVGVYLTANVLVLPDELHGALEMIDAAWAAGIDAVIVQDLGLLRLVREVLPHVRIHSSTQINVHSSASVRALAQGGVSRITLARETSVAELTALSRTARDVGVELEAFVHGALCVCYSGQCLLSSLIGGRSANRGLCAQPCRLPYELVDEAGEVLGDVGAHLLSPKDLAGITLMPDLVASGVSALKIEGRMKSAEYVALVTGVYRSAIDRAKASPEEYSVRDGEMSVLSEAFSRGFTEAYLAEKRGNEIMSYRRPNNRGVPVGRILRTEGAVAHIKPDVALDAEDVIEVWTSRGRFAQPVGVMSHSGADHSTAPAGVPAAMRLTEPASPGDRVFRVRNAALTSAAQRTFATEPLAEELAFEVKVVVGEPLTVTVAGKDSRTASATGPVVEAARTKPVSVEEITEHVGRLGGSGYSAGSWDVILSPNAGIGFSSLHKVRRAAVEAYEAAVLSAWSERRPHTPPLPDLAKRRAEKTVRVVAVCGDLDAARACLEAGADSVHVPSWAIGVDAVPSGVWPVAGRVAHDSEFEAMLAAARAARQGVAGTLGALSRLAEEGVPAEAHWGLNAVNAYTVAELADLGASFVWLSPELSSRQVAAVAERGAVPVGIAVAGRQELMVTEHCVLMTEGACAQRCTSCDRRRGVRYLKDRKGYRFPVITDPMGRTHVYNAVTLDLTASMREVLSTGVAAVRVDAETLDAPQAAALVGRVLSAVTAAYAGRDVDKPAGAITSGHFFRGVR